MSPRAGPILITGGGIAGLTAALAFARHGFEVALFERAAAFEEIGAGLQLSPNATRILRRLGVLDRLLPLAVAPEAVTLRAASDLTEIAHIPLGRSAERRWGAPYLAIHRADLHRSLLEAAESERHIALHAGTAVQALETDTAGGGVSLLVETNGEQRREPGRLAIGADGVWSTLRAAAGEAGRSRFIGRLAWRRTIAADSDAARTLRAACPNSGVTAFLHPGFHLIAYPIRAGAELNLAAFTRAAMDIEKGWANATDIGPLRDALAGTATALSGLADGAWTAWPLHVADPDGAWIDPNGLALIGDAAHAMTPFAAQGAAMAIEDAESLARAVACGGAIGQALTDWAAVRRRRVAQVARRGALNQFTWHAAGPVAAARNLVLRTLGPERLAAQLDWLYGWDAGSG